MIYIDKICKTEIRNKPFFVDSLTVDEDVGDGVVDVDVVSIGIVVVVDDVVDDDVTVLANSEVSSRHQSSALFVCPRQ